jgi:hypothetical protein
MADYVCQNPDTEFLLNHNKWEWVTYNELVNRFEEMTK